NTRIPASGPLIVACQLSISFGLSCSKLSLVSPLRRLEFIRRLGNISPRGGPDQRLLSQHLKDILT
ncbi:MAG: hypothetical protein VX249_03310, partial [Pseudomonadota bacterium]|nr:hypothetical protein [Pseudomonadota bacterium]